MTRFGVYGQAELGGLSYSELLYLQDVEHSLHATAENSGCEGFYCEVARWDYNEERWYRYAFIKFFDGDDPAGVMTAQQMAQWTADKLNAAKGNLCPKMIHNLPDWPTW